MTFTIIYSIFVAFGIYSAVMEDNKWWRIAIIAATIINLFFAFYWGLKDLAMIR